MRQTRPLGCGDLAGCSLQPEHRAGATLVAITSVSLCAAPDPATAALRRAYAASAACAETYLLNQIARVGRMTAAERLEDLLAELLARLRLSGCAQTNSCALQLPQGISADATGLAPVHLPACCRARRARTDCGRATACSSCLIPITPGGRSGACRGRDHSLDAETLHAAAIVAAEPDDGTAERISIRASRRRAIDKAWPTT